MAVGDVFLFVTTHAKGHDKREKLHIFLGTTDHFRAPAEYAFLFISSANYDQCFPISFADYGEFLKYDSFISCGNLVFYSADELKEISPKKVGSISHAHLGKLREHLADHEVMVGWQITVVCEAIDKLPSA